MLNRLLLCATLVSAFAFGQPGNIEFTPAGAWPLCEAGAYPANSPFCAGIVKGEEPYLLQVEGTSTAVAFEYTITGTAPDGTARTFHDVFLRNPAAGQTSNTIVKSGILKTVNIVVLELVPAAVQASRAPFTPTRRL